METAMKIAAISAPERGETDRLITVISERLLKEGARLSGIVKVLQEMPEGTHHCDMEVRVLPGERKIAITQSLGDGSEGCRLNPTAIAEAVAAVESAAEGEADLFVLNKFGPEEADGRGFRQAIGSALEQGVPVLVGVTGGSRAAFDEFAAGLADMLPADEDAIAKWCRDAIAG